MSFFVAVAMHGRYQAWSALNFRVGLLGNRQTIWVDRLPVTNVPTRRSSGQRLTLEPRTAVGPCEKRCFGRGRNFRTHLFGLSAAEASWVAAPWKCVCPRPEKVRVWTFDLVVLSHQAFVGSVSPSLGMVLWWWWWRWEWRGNGSGERKTRRGLGERGRKGNEQSILRLLKRVLQPKQQSLENLHTAIEILEHEYKQHSNTSTDSTAVDRMTCCLRRYVGSRCNSRHGNS